LKKKLAERGKMGKPHLKEGKIGDLEERTSSRGVKFQSRLNSLKGEPRRKKTFISGNR